MPPPLLCEIRRHIPYDDGSEWMRRAIDDLVAEAPGAREKMLLAEFLPVVTLGRSGDGRHLRMSPEKLAADGVEYRAVGRGGDVTWHGPGQWTVYPVLRLQEGERDVHRHLRRLEQGVIDWLAGFGLEAGRRDGLSGVWIGHDKLAAVGVSFRRWVTGHGLAVNVCPDLGKVGRWIVPCGIAAAEGGITSLERASGAPRAMEDVAASLAERLASALGREAVWSV